MSTGFGGEEEEEVKPRVYHRRRYRAVLAEALIKTVGEELGLENHPNGSAGIPIWARAIRVGVKTVGTFYHINSHNLSRAPGTKWEALTPMKIWRDQGQTCNFCTPGALST